MKNRGSFRLWWAKEKRMVYKGALTFDIEDGKWLWEGRSGSFHSSFGTLMEGTGIEIRHKKELKELFVGDIIRIAKKDIVQIVKDEQTGNFTTEPAITYADWGWNETMCDHRDRIELIGNIFENPEKLYI